jgi:prepilin-type N-terminal cleavage/methylation domain-containing protein
MLKSCLSKLPRKPVHHAVFSRHGFLRCNALAKAWVNYKQQNGFTLLEMLVVIGLIGIVAMGSATLLIDDGDWKRQDETVKRWDAIRKAIIGEPNLSLNGSPYVAGYVADMGRLPNNITELFIQGTQPNWTEIELYKKTAATNCTTTPDDCYWLSGGWRGPYLYTAGSAQYRDAWNNQDANAAEDTVNFGWNVSLDGTPQEITVQSLGSDNAQNGTGYSQDFPLDPNQTMVSSNEWTLSANTVTFNINFNRTVTATDLGTPPYDLELRIYRYMDNGDGAASFANDVSISTAINTFQLTENLAYAPAQSVIPEDDTTSNPMPIGRFAAVIWCTGVAPEVVYDGDCDSTNNHNPVYFTLTHNTSQVSINWNLP